jgi:hypothetical protein
MKELRFEFGVRYWLVDQWKGYTTVDKREGDHSHDRLVIRMFTAGSKPEFSVN